MCYSLETNAIDFNTLLGPVIWYCILSQCAASCGAWATNAHVPSLACRHTQSGVDGNGLIFEPLSSPLL
jgi:hypothetical protein